jgi:uncharacterized membrane protein YgcG
VRTKFSFLALVGLVCLFTAPALAQGDLPKQVGRISDFAKVTARPYSTALEDDIVRFEEQTNVEFVIVTVYTLNGLDIVEYAHRLAAKWEVGEHGRRGGIVMLVSAVTRETHIAAFGDAKQLITGETVMTIIDKKMAPSFKNGDLMRGIMYGACAIMDTINPPQPKPFAFGLKKPMNRVVLPTGIIIAVLAVIIAVRSRRAAKRRVLKNLARIAERIPEVAALLKHGDLKPRSDDPIDAARQRRTEILLGAERGKWLDIQPASEELLGTLEALASETKEILHQIEEARRGSSVTLTSLELRIGTLERLGADGKLSLPQTGRLRMAKTYLDNAKMYYAHPPIDWRLVYSTANCGIFCCDEIERMQGAAS